MKLKWLLRGEFSRNIITLLTGTALAQAIPILMSPILTRIFTPEEFGVFAVYMSVVFIVASFSCGKYELAIMLPKKEKDSFILMILSISVCIFISLLSVVPFFLFNSEIALLVNSKAVGGYLYLAPIAVLLIGCYQSLFYYNSRKKAYLQISQSKVLQAGTMAGVNVSSGILLGGVGSLVLGHAIGQLFGIFSLVKSKVVEFSEVKKGFSYKGLIRVGKEYKKFPLFFSFSYGLNTFSGNLTPFILTASFDVKYAGYFLIVQRAIASPIGIISRSVGDVFFQKASHQIDSRKLYLLTSASLFAVGLFPTVIIFFFAESLFSFFFGEEWREAGEIASTLIIMFFLSFVTTPVSQFSTIHQKVFYNIMWQLLLVCSILTAWWVGVCEGSVLSYMFYYAVFQSVLYVYGYFYEYRLCLQQCKNEGSCK